MSDKIVIIGSGNVATHLAKGFAAAGCDIVQVYSRTLANASRLGQLVGADNVTDNLDNLVRDADLYVIAVADAAVGPIADSMLQVNGLVVHTSGSVALDTLKSTSNRAAVLYPLQTFTREADVKLAEVPFFTEATDNASQSDVDRYASMLSPKVYHADSARRKTLHIAGVLSCNFVNYLWDCTSRVLEADGYDFSVVEPLIRATLDKAVALGPRAAQTGPAMRRDIDVMRSHLDLLDEDTADLYKKITNSILKTHKLDCEL